MLWNLFLLGDTDGATTTTSRLGVLTTDTEAPVVTQTTVRDDLLQTLQIITQFRLQIGGGELRVLAVNDVLLSIQEPIGYFILQRVRDDGYNLLDLKTQ